MSEEIQLYYDGDGLLVLGEAEALERFIASEDLPSEAQWPLKPSEALNVAGYVAQVGATVAENSGRWMKLTSNSAELIKKYGLMESATDGLKYGVIGGGKHGKIKALTQFEKGTLASPALLAGVGGVMAQFAAQQAMAEITDYLERISAKVDDILRSQKDSYLAKVMAADTVVREAFTIRVAVGGVPEVAWSKIDDVPTIVAEAQAYALLQLDGEATKLEQERNVECLPTLMKETLPKVLEWLAVLAYCEKLKNALSVLELDRVSETNPENLEWYRLALRRARLDRLDRVNQSTNALLNRVNDAAELANEWVLLHPFAGPQTVQASNQLAATVTEFRVQLGIESETQTLEAKQWLDALGDVWDQTLSGAADLVGQTVSVFGGGAEAPKELSSSAMDGSGDTWQIERPVHANDTSERRVPNHRFEHMTERGGVQPHPQKNGRVHNGYTSASGEREDGAEVAKSTNRHQNGLRLSVASGLIVEPVEIE
ncbi:MAG: hypothetical protein LBR20_08190 [Propionibacteriaceae bacterium]|jgi:hypothetical protein|nr:hypothetical protein [Propionibacteriaceae bacterium]